MESKSHFLAHFIPGMLLGSVVGLAFGSLLVASQIPHAVTSADIARELGSNKPLSASVIAALNAGIAKNNQADTSNYAYPSAFVSNDAMCLIVDIEGMFNGFFMRGDAESAPTFAEDYAFIKKQDTKFNQLIALLEDDKLSEPYLLTVNAAHGLSAVLQKYAALGTDIDHSAFTEAVRPYSYIFNAGTKDVGVKSATPSGGKVPEFQCPELE